MRRALKGRQKGLKGLKGLLLEQTLLLLLGLLRPPLLRQLAGQRWLTQPYWGA